MQTDQKHVDSTALLRAVCQ